MAKVITKTAINWGGFNPEIKNKVSIEMKEISRSEAGVNYQITDNILIEKQTEDGNFYHEIFCSQRNKTQNITSAQYDYLFALANSYIDTHYPAITQLEKDILLPKVALLLFVQTDLLPNGLCGYNTNPNDWEIC